MKYTVLNSLTLGDLFDLYLVDKKLNFQSNFLVNHPYPLNIIKSVILHGRFDEAAKTIVACNFKKGYDVLYDECDLASAMQFIENNTALPNDSLFGELEGCFFRDLPCIMQKSILQTKVRLFLFFAKNEQELMHNVSTLLYDEEE